MKAFCCDFLRGTFRRSETATFCIIFSPHFTAIIFSNGSLGTPRRAPRPAVPSALEGRGSLDWSMSGCHYPSPPGPERERRYQHKVSLVVRYFMIPCNICLILLATSTLGFAVLLFLNNCTWVLTSTHWTVNTSAHRKPNSKAAFWSNLLAGQTTFYVPSWKL